MAEPVKLMQTNWIGRAKGAGFLAGEQGDPIGSLPTRPDTLWGRRLWCCRRARFGGDVSQKRRPARGGRGLSQSRRPGRLRSSVCRTRGKRRGCSTGGYAINPVSDARIPVWIADYVLSTYGTGAVLCTRSLTSATLSSPGNMVAGGCAGDSAGGESWTGQRWRRLMPAPADGQQRPFDGTPVTSDKGWANLFREGCGRLAG